MMLKFFIRVSIILRVYVTARCCYSPSIRLSVSLSVCRNRDHRLNGLRYRKIPTPYDKAMFLVFVAEFRSRTGVRPETSVLKLVSCTAAPPPVESESYNLQ